MNKQRKVVITITYNEMGIIIDTKAEEVAHPDLQPTCNELATDTISRQAAIDEITEYGSGDATFMSVGELKRRIEASPSVQTEACEYFALCRHGRDENKLRARLKPCEYCNEDSDGYVTPIEKNNHAFVRFGMNGWELSMKANGWHGSAKIRYCPMCGRDLFVK